ncbi:MAG: site-specific integrase [Pseudomonadota bacterium]
MSIYFVKNKGWRYDFNLLGIRHTETWFKTKKEAQRAESQKREELLNPPLIHTTKTDVGFLELVNLRLDNVKAYNSAAYYRDYCYMAKRWFARWGKLDCKDITSSMIEKFVLTRHKVSSHTANMEIRYLRATFNFGKKRKLIDFNPVDGLAFLPVDKRIKYVPPVEDIEKIIRVADPGTQDYLITICDTMARVSEVNNLCWNDVNLTNRYVILYTRKKRGGHLTPRKVPMTLRLFEILSKRNAARDPKRPWVYWHRYFDSKAGVWKEAPYKDRKLIMRSLCKKAGVQYFRFHALRHAGASIMDNNQVPIGTIQRILGHENRSTTEIYLHNLGNSEVEAMMILERGMQASHTNSHTDSHTETKRVYVETT